MKGLVVLLGILLPGAAEAAVSISEIAWMGSVDSANHEWIELHNDGAAADVTGWTLSDGMNLTIVLDVTIPASSYVILERTSDDSAAGPAFLIYTGALVNTGATLRLENSAGSLVDQISGGENWQNIGGDNVTKETAQYTTSGWVTAPATPGAAPASYVAPAEETIKESAAQTTASSKTTAKKISSSEAVQLTLPGVTLKLAIDAPLLGYVNQAIDFSVTPSGIGDTMVDSLQYQWNFGDGLTATQKEAAHSFAYPGTYVVTVAGEFKRQKQVTRHEITILPVAISLTKNRAGDVQVNNDSPYEIDVSGYRLLGNKEFIFPPYSVILPNQTITIPHQKLTASVATLVAIYDTASVMVTSIMPESYSSALPFLAVAAPAPTLVEPTRQLNKIVAVVNPEQTVALSPKPENALVSDNDTDLSVVSTATDSEPISTSSLVAAAGAADFPWNERLVYVALASIMLLGVLGVYATPRRNQKP